MSESLSYILYLQYDEKLDRSFFILADIFKKVGITLLPIQLSEFSSLDRNKKHHAIMVRRKFNDSLKALEWKKKKLDFMMYTGRLILHDLSSFSELTASQSLEKKGTYFYKALPIDYKEAAMDIVIQYYEDKNNYDKWPGGKRAKLFEAEKIKNA